MDYLSDLIQRYPALSICKADIESAYNMLVTCFRNGNRLYVMGNGGSAADALHIVGELAKSFILNRPLESEFVKCVGDEFAAHIQGGLPAYALVENSALSSAFANDCAPEYTFAQQVYVYARKGDCVFGISTSGNSKNVINALVAAKGRGAATIGLSGGDGGKMQDACNSLIVVPENQTFKIQELHLPIYHALCLMIEQHFWG